MLVPWQIPILAWDDGIHDMFEAYPDMQVCETQSLDELMTYLDDFADDLDEELIRTQYLAPNRCAHPTFDLVKSNQDSITE